MRALKGLFIMIFKLHVRGAIVVAAAIIGLVTLAAPARADQCDDIAKQLAGGIDGLKVNFKAANIIYLTHPAAKELSLGCRGDRPIPTSSMPRATASRRRNSMIWSPPRPRSSSR